MSKHTELRLNKLKIQSFVTSQEQQIIKGGSQQPCSYYCPTEAFHCGPDSGIKRECFTGGGDGCQFTPPGTTQPPGCITGVGHVCIFNITVSGC